MHSSNAVLVCTGAGVPGRFPRVLTKARNNEHAFTCCTRSNFIQFVITHQGEACPSLLQQGGLRLQPEERFHLRRNVFLLRLYRFCPPRRPRMWTKTRSRPAASPLRPPLDEHPSLAAAIRGRKGVCRYQHAKHGKHGLLGAALQKHVCTRMLPH